MNLSLKNIKSNNQTTIQQNTSDDFECLAHLKEDEQSGFFTLRKRDFYFKKNLNKSEELKIDSENRTADKLLHF